MDKELEQNSVCKLCGKTFNDNEMSEEHYLNIPRRTEQFDRAK